MPPLSRRVVVVAAALRVAALLLLGAALFLVAARNAARGACESAKGEVKREFIQLLLQHRRVRDAAKFLNDEVGAVAGLAQRPQRAEGVGATAQGGTLLPARLAPELQKTRLVRRRGKETGGRAHINSTR